MALTPLVCVVDDSADYRFLLKQLFSKYFSAYLVALFADGRDFLEKLPQLSQVPNLILLDRHMPKLDGHQTLLRLKESPVYKKIPVVMISADASAIEINGCYEAGVNSFLSKPTDLDSMKNQIEVVCYYWMEMNLSPVELV